MNKYPLVIMLARKGGVVTHLDAIELVRTDPFLEFYFHDGVEFPVLVANTRPGVEGWGFCYIVVYGDIQPTPCIHVRGMGFNDRGLGMPGDMATFLQGFPEIGYDGNEDPDFKHTPSGVQCQFLLTPEEMAMVIARFPSPEVTDPNPVVLPINNRTLH